MSFVKTLCFSLAILSCALVNAAEISFRSVTVTEGFHIEPSWSLVYYSPLEATYACKGKPKFMKVVSNGDYSYRIQLSFATTIVSNYCAREVDFIRVGISSNIEQEDLLALVGINLDENSELNQKIKNKRVVCQKYAGPYTYFFDCEDLTLNPNGSLSIENLSIEMKN